MENISFQAMHSPIGANATFALGLNGHGGGFGLQKERVPNQDVFIGIADKHKNISCLPFYKNSTSSQKEDFVKDENNEYNIVVKPFENDQIQRVYGYGSDKFIAENISFEIVTPVKSIPNPKCDSYSSVKDAIAPAIISRLTIDNLDNDEDIKAFFAVSPMIGKTFLSHYTGGEYKGIISNEGYGFAVKNHDNINIMEFADFDISVLFYRSKPSPFFIASMGGLMFDIPAGKKISIDIALGFYISGKVTSGEISCSYYYTNYFNNLTQVLTYAIDNSQRWFSEAEINNERLKNQQISDAKKFLITHSSKAYYASTMLFDNGGEPLWAVNEGTYMMINTMDLMIDHCFFELKYNPWVVKNGLDLYIDKYSYYDQYGISFTHDFGTHNTFSPSGTSSYEVTNLHGCFSFMTGEQLSNWILAAGLYIYKTEDVKWLEKRKYIFLEVLSSMINRTGENSDAIMDIDSNKCGTGAEITTYDSLDTSLGQARRNAYLAVKWFSSYIVLEGLLNKTNPIEAEIAKSCARKCADTIVSFFDENLGYIPAILDGENKSAIIPVVEGLVYLKYLGLDNALSINGEYKELIITLKKHIKTVLVKGNCLFEDGGFKLSQNSNNSWMSKIFISQYVITDILGIELDDTFDEIHKKWWIDGCPSNPAIDQIFDGSQEQRNFHYPRAVTSTLWW